ncbi:MULTISPECIES: hypothetical protein [Candidatus Fukatsuia]|nr:hypothetical protein [Candidatus Fukatsuia symbiotica]
MSFLTPGRYIEEKSPLRLQLEKLNDFFTDEEYDLLYCLVYKNVEKKS